MNRLKELPAHWLLIGCMGLFTLGRFAGGHLGDNAWSFTHWSYIPTWYTFAWTAVLVLAGAFISKCQASVAEIVSRGNRIYFLALCVFIGMILLRFDSFFFGAGNLRIAQIAQADHVIVRWYEWLTVTLVSLLTEGIRFVTSVKEVTAGVATWQTFSFAMTAISIVGAIAIARTLTDTPGRRLAVAGAVLFGAHSLVLFGYIGPESILPAAVLWTAWWILGALIGKSKSALLGLWITVVTAVALHASAVFLLPASLFATFQSFRKNEVSMCAVIVAIICHVGLLLAVYTWSSSNLELARNLVPFSGISPESDYGLFSLRHISDHLQRVFLIFPIVIVVFYLLVIRWRQWTTDSVAIAGLILAAGGGMTSFVVFPVNSVVSDLPRMTAYLAPGALLLVILLLRTGTKRESVDPLPYAAAFALLVPLATLPVYRSTVVASEYIEPYFKKHCVHYYAGALSFRDAFFALGNYDKSNEWEQALSIESPQHINIQGCRGLVSREEFGEAVRTLSLMKVRYPYWVEARTYLASIQLRLRRPDLARPDIDTSLMIDPFNRDALVANYGYYRETGDFGRALSFCEQTLSWYPSDTTIQLDQIALYFRSGNLKKAEELSNTYLADDSSLAFPWLIKGIAEESRGNASVAVQWFQRFIDRAPNDPDVPKARKRINDITLEAKGDSLSNAPQQ